MFEHEAWADRAFPAAAGRHGLDRRERAQAQRLAYGAVQRRGTSDHLIADARRAPGRAARPAASSPRSGSGLFELLVLGRHARTTPRSTRRSSWPSGLAAAGAGGRAGRWDSSTPSCAGRPPSARSCWPASTTRPRRAPRSLHSYPEWLARMWWEELGERRGPLADGGDERARRDRAPRQHAAAPTRGASLAELSEPRVSSVRGPGSSASPEAIVVVRGRLTERARATGSTTGRARPAVARLAGGGRAARPAAGRAGAGPLRRPRDQDHRDRRPDGATAEESSPSSATPAGRPARATSAPGWAPTCVTVIEGRRDASSTWAAATIASSWIRPAQTWGRSPRAPTRGGASRRS